jgi:hypothetical protein
LRCTVVKARFGPCSRTAAKLCRCVEYMEDNVWESRS